MRGVASALAALVFLAGCSDKHVDEGTTAGGASPAPANGAASNDTRNVCSLVSNAELSALIDKELVKSQSFMTGGDPACMWYDGENFDTVQLIVYRTGDLYEIAKTLPNSKPLAGVGDEAFIGSNGTVQVKTAKGSFMAQSVRPSKDGQISAEVQAAATGMSGEKIAEYEGSFRIAKLVAAKL